MFENFFKALGEPTRLKILRLLAQKELCVCELEEILQASQPRISQHLKVLKQAGLVSERKEGQKRICSFNFEQFTKNMDAFNKFMTDPIEEIEGFKTEVTRLKMLDGHSCDRKLV